MIYAIINDPSWKDRVKGVFDWNRGCINQISSFDFRVTLDVQELPLFFLRLKERPDIVSLDPVIR